MLSRRICKFCGFKLCLRVNNVYDFSYFFHPYVLINIHKYANEIWRPSCNENKNSSKRKHTCSQMMAVNPLNTIILQVTCIKEFQYCMFSLSTLGGCQGNGSKYTMVGYTCILHKIRSFSWDTFWDVFLS